MLVVSLDIFSIIYSKMVSFHSTPKTLAHSEDLESANSVLKIRPIVNLILVGVELGCQSLPNVYIVEILPNHTTMILATDLSELGI